MHTSIPIAGCEFINIKPMNPLIAKCQIKVCYVSDSPNRNKTVITKEVATQMANTLPGCPIVGFYNEESQDYEEHNKILSIEDGKITFKSNTVPLGFIDLNPKVWFQKFLDDNSVEREYLVTEGYIWVEQFPESKRILEKGNNHSMELADELLKGNWTRNSKGIPQFFIINEAVVSKLCVLGEEFEPCFEGSHITQAQFSLAEDFRTTLFSMAAELKEFLNEGGKNSMELFTVEIGNGLWNSMYSYLEANAPEQDENGNSLHHSQYSIEGFYTDGQTKFAVLKDRKAENVYAKVEFSLNENGEITDCALVPKFELAEGMTLQYSIEDIQSFEAERYAEFAKKDGQTKPDDKGESSSTKNEGEPKSKEGQQDPVPDDKKKNKDYSLEEIPEYVELLNNFSLLQNSMEQLQEQHRQLTESFNILTEFKNQVDRKAKEDMINSFYMLSDEDKSDVVVNIDKYSLDDIEAKLSIICVRNKVNFNLDKTQEGNTPGTTFNLNDSDLDDGAPGWLKAVRENCKKR